MNSNSRFLYAMVAAAFLFAAGYTSCKKDKTIEVSGITLSAGGSVTMKVGDQIPLTVNIEPANATRQDVTWTSSDPTVANVVSRVIHAYKEGSTTITAKAGSRTATCNVTVEAATTTYTYVIGASTLASFGTLEEGYTQPSARTVTITNTGTGAVTLDALPAVADYTLTALTATSLAAGATATFTIRPNAGLAAGTYHPTFNVTGSNGASVSISPTFTVTAATTYVISASTLASFGTLEEGYEQPSAQTVTITNTGTGAVTLDALPSVADYTLTALSATELAAGAIAMFTIRPNAGLAAGEYNPTFDVTGSASVSVSISPTFTVTAAETYSIGASPTSLSFGAQQTGYAQPAERTVTITNTGTGAVTLNALPAVANYTLGALSRTNLNAGQTATFTIRPNAGLGLGTYNPTFNVTGTNGVSVAISPAFTVSATTTYSISVTPNDPSFGSLNAPYTQPAALTVTITNDGTGAVTLNALPPVTGYTLESLSASSLEAGATATFTIRPNAGLAAGTYNPTITITGSNGASATLVPTFTVTAALTYTISASALASFGSLQIPYTQPSARTVTITNTGTGAVTLNALPAVANYTLGTLSRTNLNAGQTATFTIRPNAGLAAGTYNPTFNVTGSNGASVSISPTFTVTQAENPGSGLPGSLPTENL